MPGSPLIKYIHFSIPVHSDEPFLSAMEVRNVLLTSGVSTKIPFLQGTLDAFPGHPFPYVTNLNQSVERFLFLLNEFRKKYTP
jgi:hypothetical protein